MRLVPLNSSMVAAIGYNQAQQILVAQFQSNGRLYRYNGVLPDAFIAVITDRDSHGRSFNEHVKSRVPPDRVEETDAEAVLAL